MKATCSTLIKETAKPNDKVVAVAKNMRWLDEFINELNKYFHVTNVDKKMGTINEDIGFNVYVFGCSKKEEIYFRVNSDKIDCENEFSFDISEEETAIPKIMEIVNKTFIRK